MSCGHLDAITMNFICPWLGGDGCSVAISLSAHILLLYGGNLCLCLCLCILGGKEWDIFGQQSGARFPWFDIEEM